MTDALAGGTPRPGALRDIGAPARQTSFRSQSPRSDKSLKRALDILAKSSGIAWTFGVLCVGNERLRVAKFRPAPYKANRGHGSVMFCNGQSQNRDLFTAQSFALSLGISRPGALAS
jgi:hypothetical protein